MKLLHVNHDVISPGSYVKLSHLSNAHLSGLIHSRQDENLAVEVLLLPPPPVAAAASATRASRAVRRGDVRSDVVAAAAV